MPRVTVLIPTHNHGRLLEYAVRSALRQTISDLEIFIVGDGADERTRETAAAHAASDRRVRFFDLPKGERHGEALRHQVLQEARGEVICYLSDDDLWLPDHVEGLTLALENADFAHALPLYITASGESAVHHGHLGAPASRARVCGGVNFIPLSAAAHTRSFYRQLPRGWTPAPPSVPTDLHMWQQILAVEGCRAVSSMRATLLNFPAPLRAGWSIEQRAEELSRWTERLAEPGLERQLLTSALDLTMRWGVDGEERRQQAAADAATLNAALAEVQAALLQAERQAAMLKVALDERTAALEKAERNAATVTVDRAALRNQVRTLTSDIAAIADQAAGQRRVIDAMERTITWRVRNRLLAWAPVAALARRRSRAGPGS
jgi:hypothetical protein